VGFGAGARELPGRSRVTKGRVIVALEPLSENLAERVDLNDT
jgi:hypothetical protein